MLETRHEQIIPPFVRWVGHFFKHQKPSHIFLNDNCCSFFNVLFYVMLVITVPRDTPHFYIDGLRDVYCKRAKNRSKRWAFQSEVMLNKGQRMKITKIDRCRKIEKGWSASSDCESPTLGYPANVCVIHACLIK